MAFRQISRETLEVLNQNVRIPGVVPGAVPPGRGDATTPAFPELAVADDFIRIIPFRHVDIGNRPFARQYAVQILNNDPIEENQQLIARAASTGWEPGTTEPFGHDLIATGTRFKKISTVVRADNLMVTGDFDDVLSAQIELARIGIIRSLSEAILFSNPASDDDRELAGLPFYLPANSAQDVLFDPTRGLLSGLKEIITRCRPGDDGLGAGPDAIVTSSTVLARSVDELEKLGVTPQYRYSELTGKEEHHYFKTPIIEGRVARPDSADPVTDAWALKLTGPSSIEVLCIGGDTFGLREDPHTTLANIATTGEVDSSSRGIEIYGVYALSVKDPMSIARLRGIPAGLPS